MVDRNTNANRGKARARGTRGRSPELYASPSKEAGALVYEVCGAVRYEGRWTFRAPPLADLAASRCPACQRIADREPAGTLHVPADFLAHRDEVVNMIRNVEEKERAEHALERVMEIAEEGGRMTVTTTGIHIAREIAHKLARRFHRKARLHYAGDESRVEVDWSD